MEIYCLATAVVVIKKSYRPIRKIGGNYDGMQYSDWTAHRHLPYPVSPCTILVGLKPTEFLRHNYIFDVIITLFNYDAEKIGQKKSNQVFLLTLATLPFTGPDQINKNKSNNSNHGARSWTAKRPILWSSSQAALE